MSIQVIKKGTLDTIQDLGRTGWQHLGISTGGVMDPVSAQVANMLIGNGPQEAVLEMFLPGPVLQFESDALISITGAASVVTTEGLSVETDRPVWIKAGTSILFQPLASGRIAYLAVRGGFNLKPWLNSYSTCQGITSSGWQGRALQKGDVLPLRQTICFPDEGQQSSVRSLPWKYPGTHSQSTLPIRLLPNSTIALLTEEAQERITTAPFILQPSSNRMAYSLQGPVLEGQRVEMISSAVVRGSLQWLEAGRLHIFMADHPTTGGYPRIAQVIAADAGRLAQWPLNQPIHFEWTTRQQAEQLLRDQQSYLSRLEKSMHFRLASYLTN